MTNLSFLNYRRTWTSVLQGALLLPTPRRRRDALTCTFTSHMEVKSTAPPGRSKEPPPPVAQVPRRGRAGLLPSPGRCRVEGGPLDTPGLPRAAIPFQPCGKRSPLTPVRSDSRGCNFLGFSFHKYKMSVQIDNVVLFSINNKHILACEARRECLESAARSRKHCVRQLREGHQPAEESEVEKIQGTQNRFHWFYSGQGLTRRTTALLPTLDPFSIPHVPVIITISSL